MTMTKDKINELTTQFGRSAKDTGTTAVQVALITERIGYMSEHLRTHGKDYASQLGLMKLVGQRRRLLNYLKKRDLGQYADVIKKLNLRK